MFQRVNRRRRERRGLEPSRHQNRSHRRDAEFAEKSAFWFVSLRPLRLCGEAFGLRLGWTVFIRVHPWFHFPGFQISHTCGFAFLPRPSIISDTDRISRRQSEPNPII